MNVTSDLPNDLAAAANETDDRGFVAGIADAAWSMTQQLSYPDTGKYKFIFSVTELSQLQVGRSNNTSLFPLLYRIDDKGWTFWTMWSACELTAGKRCGNSTKTRTRTCRNDIVPCDTGVGDVSKEGDEHSQTERIACEWISCSHELLVTSLSSQDGGK